VDSNFVLADLVWAGETQAIRTCEANFSIGVIAAETAVVYAAYSIGFGSRRHLPKIAKKKRLGLGLMLTHWESYRKSLVILESSVDVVDTQSAIDPDDVPFVLLAKHLKADGILTRDPHIRTLGGSRPVSRICSLPKNYSRSAAIEFSLKMGGAASVALAAVICLALIKGAKMYLERHCGYLPQ